MSTSTNATVRAKVWPARPNARGRWARHWLDTIHFADSHGYEHDIGRDNAWRFRDYVIEAFNRDTPWSRFIRVMSRETPIAPTALPSGSNKRDAARKVVNSFPNLSTLRTSPA